MLLHNSLQYDAFDIGFITTDDFTNADILEATYPAVAKRLYNDWINDPAIPIVTGFLGKGWKSGAVTTLGRGGSDLTATAIGRALGLQEIQVWKDVDGVLTCDPSIYPRALPVPYLTFDEAAELAYFGAQVLHPQAMRPARESDIPVRVKNSYNPEAPGTLINKTRDMSKAVLTSIVLKRNVTMLDIVSTRMLGQFGFLAKVFSIFEDLGISVDVVATSEVSISLTLDPSKLWSRELIQQASIQSFCSIFSNAVCSCFAREMYGGAQYHRGQKHLMAEHLCGVLNLKSPLIDRSLVFTIIRMFQFLKCQLIFNVVITVSLQYIIREYLIKYCKRMGLLIELGGEAIRYQLVKLTQIGTSVEIDVEASVVSCWSQELDHVVEELEKIAVVNLLQHRSIISLIGNIQRSSLILEKAFNVLRTIGVNVQMISQGASKVNISLIVNDSEAEQCVKALHHAFFEIGDLFELMILDGGVENGSALPLTVENQL
ncbi:Aspartokinase 1, chloroplastic [Vitis vinifera]|uniref:aspartate kinase n=1 Tax=Vitis vinifera TaxID=29760 RepID=A0A438D188_VITVI|nr:Aspartokinase 1, chloroplastic [Vitis vinifera]